MAKAKRDVTHVNLYLPVDLVRCLDSYASECGLTRTAVILLACRSFLSSSPYDFDL